MRNISIVLMLVLLGAAGAAFAEEQAGSAGAAQPGQPSGAAGPAQAQEPSGTATATPAEQHPAAAGAGYTEQKAGAGRAAHADPNYALKLAAAVRAHVPSGAKVSAGSASCSFQVTATGSMSGISCKGSSPAHSQLLQRAIAATKAPPPPGGSFSANQSVVFH